MPGLRTGMSTFRAPNEQLLDAIALPFSSLNNEEFASIPSGPGSISLKRHERISISGSRINHLLGNDCSNFRFAGNYIAGYTKRILRKSRPKGLPKTAEGFSELCFELLLNVSACILLLMNLNNA